MSAAALLKLLSEPTHLGDFGYFFERHVRVGEEIGRVIETLDEDDLGDASKRVSVVRAHYGCNSQSRAGTGTI
jgi:hypothetical protein